MLAHSTVENLAHSVQPLVHGARHVRLQLLSQRRRVRRHAVVHAAAQALLQPLDALFRPLLLLPQLLDRVL